MFRISRSSSLLDGCDEPEILRYENTKSVPQVLTSHIDVFSSEPLPHGHPLTFNENVTLTAHAGFNTTDAARALLEKSSAQLAELMEEVPNRNP